MGIKAITISPYRHTPESEIKASTLIYFNIIHLFSYFYKSNNYSPKMSLVVSYILAFVVNPMLNRRVSQINVTCDIASLQL